jgi:hypothetical protein
VLISVQQYLLFPGTVVPKKRLLDRKSSVRTKNKKTPKAKDGPKVGDASCRGYGGGLHGDALSRAHESPGIGWSCAETGLAFFWELSIVWWTILAVAEI